MLFSNLKIREGRVVSKDQLPTNKIVYQGILITIENEEGSERKWKNENGEKRKVTMFYRYGFIDGTLGIDGEEIDCFIGHDPYASTVFIIHLGKDDKEEKVMFGFNSLEAARDAFLAHYQSQEYLGEITTMPMYLYKATL